jgi:hypothetical protein
MSIAPVASFPPASTEQSDVANARPVSGSLAKQEDDLAKSLPTTYELPEDVVEVHQDPEIKGQVIIQYLDQAKNVVLQVPSNQELGVERGIAQDFQTAARERADESTAAAGTEGKKTHGDQL